MHEHIPLWIKLAYSLIMALVIPVYASYWGMANFLWFSDIAFIGLGLALWLENSLLASILTVGALLLELGWFISFFGQLIFKIRITGLADYMFDKKNPLFIRLLSLFHLLLPPLMFYILWTLGYDRRAWLFQSLLSCIILLVVYFFTKPAENINWTFGPGKIQAWLPSGVYLILWMLFLIFGVFLPSHLLLLWMFNS